MVKLPELNSKLKMNFNPGEQQPRFTRGSPGREGRGRRLKGKRKRRKWRRKLSVKSLPLETSLRNRKNPRIKRKKLSLGKIMLIWLFEKGFRKNANMLNANICVAPYFYCYIWFFLSRICGIDFITQIIHICLWYRFHNPDYTHIFVV